MNMMNIKIIDGHSLLTPFAYRGMTRADWQKAKKAGRLLPNGEGRLYFTSDPFLAAWYARLWAEQTGDEGIVVEFPAPPVNAVFVDENGYTAGYEHMKRFRTEFFTTTPITLENVEVVGTGFRTRYDQKTSRFISEGVFHKEVQNPMNLIRIEAGRIFYQGLEIQCDNLSLCFKGGHLN